MRTQSSSLPSFHASNPPLRSIIHLDADAFFASVEQAADPRLRGKPVAVGGEKRGIVASASYEARKFGIYTPMPTVRARRLCPKLIIVPGDFEKYERFSRWMFSYAYDFTPDVEVDSIDEGYLDLSGARKSPVEIAETLRRAIRQSLKITVSEGIGSNKLVSQIASKLRKPAAFLCVPAGGERPFLHPLPNRWLPGIGPATATRMNAAGLALIGQIAVTPLEFLSLIVGKVALQMKQFANGIDDRPVVREAAPAKSYGRQETFAQDTTDEEFVEATLRRMADSLMTDIRADGKAVRTVTVKVRYNDMAEDQRSESLPEPTDLETDLYGRLRPMLRQAWKRRVSLRLVALKLSNVYDSAGNGDLYCRQHDAQRRLATTLDTLRETFGDRIMRGHELAYRARRTVVVAGVDRVHCRFHRSRAHRARLQPYVPLHVRSYYSFLDSTLSIVAIVELAKRYELPAIALTDPSNLHGAVEFVLAAKEAGIKPILGAETEINGSRVLLYVENTTGYRNLCRLLSCTKLVHDRERVLYSGLLAVSEDASLAPLFPGRFYLADQIAAPFIRYAECSDRTKYDIVQSIRTLTLLRQEHPEKNLGGDFHFPSPAEMRERFDDDQLARSLEIAERCCFDFELGKLQFPAFAPPDGSTPREFLRKLVWEGFRRRYPSPTVNPKSQIEEELAIIADVGYEEYFLVVWDILQLCRQRGIEWITRGSAADSLVCYCLGISDVCPIRFDLYFRRFLNKERMALNKLPDIDVDFPHDRKDDVIDLIFAKYGAEHTAVVGGFSTFLARSALGDVAKVLGVSEYQIRRFTERVPRVHASDLDAVLAQSPETRDLPVTEEPYATALKMAQFLDGFPRYPKMHPCGVVLSRAPMADLTPCFTSNKGYPTTHFDMDSVEAIGLVKMDILAQGGLAAMRDVKASLAKREYGLSQCGRRLCAPTGCSFELPQAGRRAEAPPTLACPLIHTPLQRGVTSDGRGTNRFSGLSRGVETVETVSHVLVPPITPLKRGVNESRPEPQHTVGEVTELDLRALEPWDDPNVWEMIASGGARAVHHIESPAMVSLCRMCNVREIDGLIAIVSVIRPGAANEMKKRSFTRRYQGLEPITYPHPSLEACLKSTFGLVVYEEHILQICDAFAGLSPGRADVLRRALVKEKWKTVEEIGKEFVASARARGRADTDIAEVWKLVCGFHGYAFCRAHSTAYGVEAYQSAWLKRYYPAEFMAAVLSNGKGFYQPLVYVLECHRLGIPLLSPWVNEPGPMFTVCSRALQRGREVVPDVQDRAEPGAFTNVCPFRPPAPIHTPLQWGDWRRQDGVNRFSGFDTTTKTAEAVGGVLLPGNTPLKWGVNEKSKQAIRVPATRVKGLSERTCEQMISERARGEFSSLTDFYRRVAPTNEEMELLLKAGAFDGFGKTRTALFWEIQHVTRAFRGECEPNQGWLLPSPGTDRVPEVPLTEPTKLDRLRWETELFDFPVSEHPLAMYPDIAWDTYCPVADLGKHVGETVVCCGLIVEDRVHEQVDGDPMKFLTIADWTGMVETELFAKTYKNYGLATVRYPVLEITATVEPYENGRGFSLRVHRAGKPRQKSA